MALTPDEVRFLRGVAQEIDELGLGLTKASVLADAHQARERYGEYGRAVVEVASARRAGSDKFESHWLADSDSAQQATPRAVADERARFLASHSVSMVHDVTCSIGTEAPSFYAAGIDYLGSDLDTARLLMARHNLGGDAWLVRADALQPISRAEVIVADPARRAGGRRIKDPADLLPPVPDLVAAHQGAEMAIKCAPGIDYSQWEGLVVVMSVAGAVKETCLYTPGFGRGRRAVTSLGSVDSSEPDEVGDGPAGKFLLDPDGAIVRAGLVKQWAYRHRLWMLDERIAYLTGDHIPAGHSGFEIFEQVPLKKLKAALAPYRPGSLEILVRGVDVDPDRLRTKLKPGGENPMTVVCTRIGRSGVALICGPRQWA